MDKESGRIDPNKWEELPQQESMKPSSEKRQKPSTDQRKIRRKMRKSREDKQRKKTATIVNTSVERINPGDEIRTPTGQTTTVRSVRRHEYRADFVYLDTDLGTTVVKRGTPVQVIVGNAAQQSVTPGHPWGNTDILPMSGRGPAGTSGPLRMDSKDCPVCGQKNTLYLTGQYFKCRNCGFEMKAGTVPFGGQFSNQDRMYLPGLKPGEVPVSRYWASKENVDDYRTAERPSLLTRRAQDVLNAMEES